MWLDNQSAVNQHLLWYVPSAWGAIKLLVVNDCCSSGTLTSLGRQRGGGGVPDWKMNFAHTILHFEPRAVHFSVCKRSKFQRLEQELQDQTSSLLFQWRPLLSSFYQGRHWHDKIDQASPPPKPSHFCILQAIKKEGLGTRLQEPHDLHCFPSAFHAVIAWPLRTMPKPSLLSLGWHRFPASSQHYTLPNMVDCILKPIGLLENSDFDEFSDD